MLYFPKPSLEPIVYYSNAQAAGITGYEEVNNEMDENLEANTGELGETQATEPTATKPSSTSKQVKPTVKPKATPTPGKVTAKDPKININTATKQQLMRLPGVGEATADKIISYRDNNGGFSDIIDIMKVSGIGTAKYENMKDLIEI